MAYIITVLALLLGFISDCQVLGDDGIGIGAVIGITMAVFIIITMMCVFCIVCMVNGAKSANGTTRVWGQPQVNNWDPNLRRTGNIAQPTISYNQPNTATFPPAQPGQYSQPGQPLGQYPPPAQSQQPFGYSNPAYPPTQAGQQPQFVTPSAPSGYSNPAYPPSGFKQSESTNVPLPPSYNDIISGNEDKMKM